MARPDLTEAQRDCNLPGGEQERLRKQSDRRHKKRNVVQKLVLGLN